MSEENVSEVVETVSETPVEASGPTTEELQQSLTVFDKNEMPSSEGTSNPEANEDWEADLDSVVKQMESKKDEKEEESLEASSEQQADTDKTEQEEAKSEVDSDAQEEELDAEEASSPESESGAIEVKIDGEVQSLTLEQIREEHPEVLEDLKSGISGAKASAKRFSELDSEKKAFYAEKQQIEGYVNQFADATKDGNILGGLTYFAEFANIPPYLLKEQLIASLRPEIEKRNLMSQEEINNVRLKEENEYLTQKNESDHKKWEEEQARLKAEQAEQDLQNQINSIRETHKVTDEEWDQVLDELDKELPPEMETIPLQAMQERIIQKRQDEATNTRLNTLVEPVRDQVNDTFVSELRQLIVSHPELSDQDIQTVIKDSIKKASEAELQKNLEKKSLEQPKRVIPNDSNRSFKDLQNIIEWD